jgi:hypothetical protein
MSRPPVVASVKVEGLRELQRELRRLEETELRKELRGINKDAARIVADEGKARAPSRTGRLAASITPKGEQRGAVVQAGSASRVPYAGPIHFGWAARNIEPNPFLYDALSDRWSEVYNSYQKALDDLVDRFNDKR